MKKTITVLMLSTLSFATVTAKNDQAIIKTGNSCCMKLMKKLKGELVTTMKSKGPLAAINICAEKAYSITKSVENSIGNGIELKRTTFKYRDPLDKPDKYEKEALEYFENALKQTGKLPKYYIQKVHINGKTYYKYYKPLRISKACLMCHGSNVNPKISEKIHENYPNDKAMGYKLGDFRGVVVATIPQEAIQ